MTRNNDSGQPPASPCGNCTYVKTRKFGWVLKHNSTCPQHRGLTVR